MEPNSSYSHRGTGSSRTQIYRSLASNLLPAPVWEENGRSSSQWSPLSAILPHICCPQISGKCRKRTALSLDTPRTRPHWRAYCPLGSVWKRRPTPGTVWPECWWAPGSASTTWTGTTAEQPTYPAMRACIVDTMPNTYADRFWWWLASGCAGLSLNSWLNAHL